MQKCVCPHLGVAYVRGFVSPPRRTTDPGLGRATIPPPPSHLGTLKMLMRKQDEKYTTKAEKGTCSLNLGVEASRDMLFFFYCLSLSLNYICSPSPKNIACDD